MKLSPLIKRIIGHITQVTEYKYAIPVLRYNPSCDGVQFVPTCYVLSAFKLKVIHNF